MELEICCGDIYSIRVAAEAGAKRVELCCALSEGGLTPPLSMIEFATEAEIPSRNALIRPRCGDFLYSADEIRAICSDIRHAVRAGATGIVCGALTADGVLDMEAMRAFREAAGEVELILHRAFDVCRDRTAALEKAIDAGFHRVLTSGGQPTALEGATELRRLKEQARGRIKIMAGCGVTPKNIADIIAIANPDAIHATAKRNVGSAMQWRATGVSMGTPGADEYTRLTADPAAISNLLKLL